MWIPKRYADRGTQRLHLPEDFGPRVNHEQHALRMQGRSLLAQPVEFGGWLSCRGAAGIKTGESAATRFWPSIADDYSSSWALDLDIHRSLNSPEVGTPLAHQTLLIPAKTAGFGDRSAERGSEDRNGRSGRQLSHHAAQTSHTNSLQPRYKSHKTSRRRFSEQ